MSCRRSGPISRDLYGGLFMNELARERTGAAHVAKLPHQAQRA